MSQDSTQRKLQIRYVTIATRPEHEIRGKLLALAKSLSDKAGMKVSTMDALNIAVSEALRKRGAKP
jgi:hypothetical protein